MIAVALFLELALIKAPMALTRLRMHYLLADFHSIYPTQSTWSDAQHLMTRWGRWGHYDGTCTWADCDYTIHVSDPYSRWRDRLSERQGEWLFRSHLLPLMAHLGWRGTGFSVRFVVQDSKIVRNRTGLGLYVFNSGPEHYSYGLGLGSQVRSRLSRPNPRERNHEPWILGTDEQLDDHPDYKVGRPGGCLGCENVEFTYTSSLLHADLVRLTAYDLSCLTRLHSCTQIGDLLPAGHDWHLYDGDMMGPKVSGGPGPIPCRTDPRALGRDAEIVLEVEPLSIEKHLDAWTEPPLTDELTRVRLLRAVKGIFDTAPGATLLIFPFPGSNFDKPTELPEHLVPGHHYFVLLDSSEAGKDGQLRAPRCGVLDDTPANLAALQTGIAQDIPYRRPPKFGE
jgi:hypothetical protein